MSKPQPGTYVIYNKVLSPSGDKLAITFNGQGATATITPLSNSEPQKWIIADYIDGKTQSITPTANSRLQAAWGANLVTVLPAGSFVWTIRKIDAGYTIKDGGVTVIWGVAVASNGASVTIGNETYKEEQIWIFECISTVTLIIEIACMFAKFVYEQ